MEKVVLRVEGMSCSHCENAVKKAAGSISGVTKADVDLKGKTVTIEHDPSLAPISAIIEAIEEQGYDVIR